MPARRRTAASVAYAKVSVKSQTVIPLQVREALGIGAGDTLRFRSTRHGIVLDKAPAAGDGDPFVAFGEWASAEDERAFEDL